MNSTLLAYIKQLTASDPKSLTAMGLKLSEETGEAAKAILPYEGAHATTHRFIVRDNILEEAVDTMIVALSIAYRLGYNDEEIADMMKDKSDYWAKLQHDQSKIKDRVPFELHITVKCGPDDTDKFRGVCETLEVKPIVLELPTKSGHMIDVMTSSTFVGTNAEVDRERARIVKGLKVAGFTVVREKIETVPWHPAAPQEAQDNMPTGCYFEAHVGVQTHESRLGVLRDLIEKIILPNCSVRVSRNVLKKHDAGVVTIMVTARALTGTYSMFELCANQVRRKIEDGAFIVPKKTMIEFSIYDTKVSHDSNWT